MGYENGYHFKRKKVSEPSFRTSAKRHFRFLKRNKRKAIQKGIPCYIAGYNIIIRCINWTDHAIMLPPQQGKQTSSHLSVGNLCSESRKRNFLRPEIQNFPWGACPWTPLVKSASGADCQSGKPYTQVGTPPCKRLATPLVQRFILEFT